MFSALHRQKHQIDDVCHAFQHSIKVLLLLLVDRPDVEQSSRLDYVLCEQHEYGEDIFEFRFVALVGRQDIVQIEIVRRIGQIEQQSH